MSWIYQNRIIEALEEVPTGAIGFVYKISAKSSGKFYIGKKQLFTNRRVKITNKEKLESGNNRRKFKQVVKESDWKSYCSSSKELQQEFKNLGEDAFQKEILEFCFDKRSLSYKEVWWQFKLDVLANDTWNANILSRFFRAKDI